MRVLEAVPNFSEGRDPDTVEALVACIAGHDVEVLDWSSDPDHHRSVVTFIGAPGDVEAAAVASARFARDHIDLRGHQGVHPRVGALDVLPFVPVHGLEMSDAVASAKRVAAKIAELGVPVYLYGRASDPPGRGLAELRRGGSRALQAPPVPIRRRGSPVSGPGRSSSPGTSSCPASTSPPRERSPARSASGMGVFGACGPSESSCHARGACRSP